MEGSNSRGRATATMAEMEEQQQMMTQQQQQQQQQQLLLFQQLQQRQKHQDAIMSRFPSNIDAHLRGPHLLPHRSPHSPNPNPNPSPSPNPNPNPNPTPTVVQTTNNNGSSSSSNQQQQQQVKAAAASRPTNPIELQMAYQDAWRVCHPDFKRPFTSLEDACDRLLPYHVVADYEAEEDDKILDSDTTGQIMSRSQQWDHNIAAKVAEFTATFEKQVLAFNIISRKRELGEFRTEEKLMVEQLLLQDEKRSLLELRAQLDSRQKAGRETQESNLRMAAMAHADQARAESQAHSEMMVRAPIRASVLGSQSSNISIGHDMGDEDQVPNPDEILNGWGNSAQKDEKEPSEDFLNDEETENGEAAMQSEWRGAGELDLNTR